MEGSKTGAKAEKNGKQADASVQRLEQDEDRCTINLLHVVCTKSLTRQLVEFMECLSARRDPYDLYYDYEVVGARKGCFSVNVKTATRSGRVACFRNCSTHAECAKNFYSLQDIVFAVAGKPTSSSYARSQIVIFQRSCCWPWCFYRDVLQATI